MERKEQNQKETIDREEERIREAFARLSPTEGQRQRMWEAIRRNERKRRRRPPRLAAAIALVCILGVAAVGVSAASGGHVPEMIRTLCGWDPGSEEVVDRTHHLLTMGTEVYAPEIFSLDEKWLIFGGRSGVILYYREKQSLAATIDVQAIDCFYFYGNDISTHVLRQGESLAIFNSKNGKAFGKYYLFAMPQNAQDDGAGYEAVQLTAQESGEDAARWRELYRAWEKAEKNYQDSFEVFLDETFIQDVGKGDGSMYSERSLRWTASDGSSLLGCLVVDGVGNYRLYMKDEKSGEVTEEALPLVQEKTGTETEESTQETFLPEFHYSGDDEVLRAISDYMCENFKDDYYEPGEGVFIPSPVIYARRERGNELLVFGDFWHYSYVRNGQLLEDCSGGSMAACFHLQKEGDGYRVTEIDRAGDGAYYDRDIREFTADYPEIYDMYFDEANGEAQEAVRTKWLSMYVQDNGLDIKYYKDYGWDPVEIDG